MTIQLITILGPLTFLHVKHYLCDFVLQNQYQLRGKRAYGQLGGAVHAMVHALATTPVFLLLAPPLGLAAGIVAAEFFYHYHLDWLKEQILTARDWGPEKRGYWHILGLDQMLHNLTYVGIVAVAS